MSVWCFKSPSSCCWLQLSLFWIQDGTVTQKDGILYCLFLTCSKSIIVYLYGLGTMQKAYTLIFWAVDYVNIQYIKPFLMWCNWCLGIVQASLWGLFVRRSTISATKTPHCAYGLILFQYPPSINVYVFEYLDSLVDKLDPLTPDIIITLALISRFPNEWVHLSCTQVVWIQAQWFQKFKLNKTVGNLQTISPPWMIRPLLQPTPLDFGCKTLSYFSLKCNDDYSPLQLLIHLFWSPELRLTHHTLDGTQLWKKNSKKKLKSQTSGYNVIKWWYN